MKAPTTASAIGVRFMTATVFGSGLLGVRLLNDGGCKSETKDKY